MLDLCAYLAALINPRDETALLGALASPLGADASLDALALLGMGRVASEQPLWEVLAGDVETWGAALPPAERARIAGFAEHLQAERVRAPRLGLDTLLERAVARSRYDEHVLRLPGGEQRLANVDEADRHGCGLRSPPRPRRCGRWSTASWGEIGAEAREADAPVELAGLDAVRLMTIHAAKGLEFPVVVVADLGRRPRSSSGDLLVDGDEVGIRVQLMHGQGIPALDHVRLSERRAEAGAAEERRLFHVAMTRAEEHLILTGAMKVGNPPAPTRSSPPILWLVPALQAAGIEPAILTPATEPPAPAPPPTRVASRGELAADRTANSALDGSQGLVGAAVATMSYSSLTDYARCGYRFYLKRVLRLPDQEPPPEVAQQTLFGPAIPTGALTPLERGSLAHRLLEDLVLEDLRPPTAQEIAAVAALHEVVPTETDVADLQRLVEAALRTDVMGRVAAARTVHREQEFALALTLPGTESSPLLHGFVDLLAFEPDGGALIVDYKTDHLGEADPEAVVAAGYSIQRAIYALAALRSGAPHVEVVHLFLERPAEPAVVRHEQADADDLERLVLAHAAGLLAHRFEVTETPYRELCATCPGRGGLCSWPQERALRDLGPAAH